MHFKFFFLFIVFKLELINLILAGDKSTDHLVIRILPKTKDQLNYLIELERNASFVNKLDFWKSPKSVNLPVDLMIEESAKKSLLNEMRLKKIQFTPIINSVEE